MTCTGQGQHLQGCQLLLEALELSLGPGHVLMRLARPLALVLPGLLDLQHPC